MVFEHLEEKEAVKRAALIENNGYRFYTLLAARVSDARTKAILKKLADDERNHLKIIETKFFHEAGFSDQITEEEVEIEDYIERSGDVDIFSKRIDVEALLATLDTPKKALTVALDTEKHSVRYFEEMARRSRTDEGRKIYLELVQEEKSHVAQVEMMLANY